MANWIPDKNRYALAAPPAWWLTRLHEFDASLVVIPSQQHPLYRLAQKRKVQLTEKMLKDPFFQESDTQMMARYGLIPVTSILGNANWSDPAMFQELANRAPWRLGGAEKVIHKLEASEAREELNKSVRTDDHLTSLGKDGWGLYNKKIGTRSHMYIPRSKKDIVRGGSKSAALHIK